jgi:von Willebrand factor type A domain
VLISVSPCRHRLLDGARLLLVCAVFSSAALHAAPPADVALAVVYDTSGSMKTPIRAQDGRLAAKHVIAQRAFGLVIDRLDRFTQPAAGQPAKRLDLGIVIFEGVRTRQALPMAPFDVAATRRWLAALPAPDSGTPLGDAMLAAGGALQSSSASNKHLLVLTDGENTTGASPLAALATLQKQSRGQDQPVFVHVIALDISPEVFASLQKAGATLIGAADEKQLQSQLDFILETQILVEAP